MNLYKSMQGSVEIAANLNHTGKNVISEGTLAVEGTIMGMVELQARGTLAGNPIIKGELQFEGALNYEGCRLSPGTEKNPYGQITVAHDLTINQAIYVEENIKSEGEKQQDRFVVLGNLNKKLSPSCILKRGGEFFFCIVTRTSQENDKGLYATMNRGRIDPFCESKMTKTCCF